MVSGFEVKQKKVAGMTKEFKVGDPIVDCSGRKGVVLDTDFKWYDGSTRLLVKIQDSPACEHTAVYNKDGSWCGPSSKRFITHAPVRTTSKIFVMKPTNKYGRRFFDTLICASNYSKTFGLQRPIVEADFIYEDDRFVGVEIIGTV